MPDESDDRESPGEDDVDAEDDDGGAHDSDASDGLADSDGGNTDSEPDVDDADSEPDVDDADSEPDADDPSLSDGLGDTDGADVDPEHGDVEDDDDTGGLQKVDEDDDGTGGLRKVESEVDPEVEPSFGPTEGSGRPEGPRRPDADPHDVPNRGVEAGFDEPPAGGSPPPEKGPGPGPRPHPDRQDSDDSSEPPDVPVGHASGAPSPGEAAASAAGTGTGTGGAGGGGGGTATGGGYDPADDDILEGPPDDEEMPLADHIEEMVLRLAAVITVGAVATAIMYLYSDRLVVIMWNDILPAGVDAARPHLYGPLEFILTKIKVASLAGVLIAAPVLVYQSYLFMRPGLYPRERRYYLAAVPTSLVLAVVGMGFAYFLVLPGLFNYFLYYTQGNAEVAFGLAATFNLIVALMGLLAVVFQIPLMIMLAIMMGVTTRQWLEDRRILFWGAFAGIAFLFAPDPTGMAPFIIAVTMIVLFEGTLLLLRWTGR